MDLQLLRLLGVASHHEFEELDADVECTHNGGQQGIECHQYGASAGELQAETHVDEAGEHECAAVPDVAVRDDTTGVVLQVVLVVEISEDGLDEHGPADDGANRGVCGFQTLFGQTVSKIHSYFKFNEGPYNLQCRDRWQRRHQGRSQPT